MASIGERLRSFILSPNGKSAAASTGTAQRLDSTPAETKAALTQAPYATTIRATVFGGQTGMRRGARMLRNLADRSEALRTAITWRKQQVSRAEWRIVRVDDPKRAPKKRVVDEATKLFRSVNTKRESFRSLLEQVVEDLLVLDAGVIEKERNGAKEIACLWAVDGSTIAPDPNWDGRDPKAIRYRQYMDGRLIASLRNDQMIYIMQNQSTHRILGWSPVETLVQVIEAELYGERYDYQMLQQAAPAGMLWLGTGLSEEQLASFRAYYESEIAGTKEVAIFGGGFGGDVTGPGAAPSYTKFGWSPKDMQRDEYKSWLINKICFVFQLDKTIFGLVDDVNRSTSKSMSDRTDQGFASLAQLVAEFITREIIWELDENHGFEFTNLVDVNPLALAQRRQIYNSIGVTTPNEIRAEEGLDPVEWGDVPFPLAQARNAIDPAEDADEQDGGDAAKPDNTKPKPGKDDNAK
jgi:HK97 family phage portal protein